VVARGAGHVEGDHSAVAVEGDELGAEGHIGLRNIVDGGILAPLAQQGLPQLPLSAQEIALLERLAANGAAFAPTSLPAATAPRLR
jgi:hypothetical protein